MSVMIRRSTDGKQRVLSLSYGKDSMACLGALEALGWPLDRIVTADVWATDTIPADLPPMVEFKDYADKVIMERYGIEVEHFRSDVSYEDVFYRERKTTRRKDLGVQAMYGWPYQKGPWCNDRLKMAALKKAKESMEDSVSYIGIAIDEPSRFHNLTDTTLSPLVETGWAETDCREWCEKNGLLSPIYTQAARGGCWFCHNQSVQQLRLLRKQYPDLWSLLLKWDSDSHVTFHADGHTVHDYDKRFALEDEGLLAPGEPFRWNMMDGNIQYKLF